MERDHTWKWVFTRDSLTIRMSHNTRSPTTLAEAIAGGAKTKKTQPAWTRAYADLHRQALAKESVVAQASALLKKKDLPPHLRADTELVLGMGLAAKAGAALDESPPRCLHTVFAEAARLAPRMKTSIESLQKRCPKK